MEDWQGCLEPQCQQALLVARDNVGKRGGSVITAEDFLLAMLDVIDAVAPFLKRQGVDFDELVRTIQGEQPIVAEVHGDGDLSSQLIYWISATREVIESPWLNWSQLLRGLVTCAERLQDKAYVAVLELVGVWPGEDITSSAQQDANASAYTPLTLVEPGWLAFVEDVAVNLAANKNGLIWVQGERGSGKTAWLQSLVDTPGLFWVQVDLRRQAEVMALEQPVVPSQNEDVVGWPVLVLDNVSPLELLELMAQPNGVAREIVSGWCGPILLLAPCEGSNASEEQRLNHLLGRRLERLSLPPISTAQRRAIITAHQPLIEKRFNIEIALSALEYAATRQSRCVASPGGMLEWVQRAAACLQLFADRGPLESVALAGRQEVAHRQGLVSAARGEHIRHEDQEIQDLELARAASEVLWHERQRAGTLRRLTVDDLRQELERWLAAAPEPVHYVRQYEQQHGDTLGAGSGNIHS
ncbi:hypothetical protein [Marinobacter litoralis]|uniref:hypothetical protein n=1 Tax=Marinobacter litoralis TaxID=187981 RepID=UPI0018EB93A3|nr:hypothetical protein [Marinobacter litoralis]MBJ6138803.1 hypothetical protein [Marinobacter litoralis]